MLKFYGKKLNLKMIIVAGTFTLISLEWRKKCKSFSKQYPISSLFSEGITWNFPLQVNNNCATGSSALYLAKQLVEGGEYYILMLSEMYRTWWFSPDVITAMLVHRTKEEKVFGEFDSIILENTSHNFLQCCTLTWPSYRMIENHLLLASLHLSIWSNNNQGRYVW